MQVRRSLIVLGVVLMLFVVRIWWRFQDGSSPDETVLRDPAHELGTSTAGVGQTRSRRSQITEPLVGSTQAVRSSTVTIQVPNALPQQEHVVSTQHPPPSTVRSDGAIPVDFKPDEDVSADIPAGSVVGDGSDRCPADYPVKANVVSGIYHLPGQGSYNQLKAGLCFEAAGVAEAAGYRMSKFGRPNPEFIQAGASASGTAPTTS